MAYKEHLKPQFIEEFEKQGGFVSPACQAVGINRDTYYQWIESDKDFKEKCEFVIEKKTDQVKKSIFASAVEDRHFPSAKYIIETRYYRQRENEIATKLDLQNQITDDMNVDIKIAILKRSLAKAEAEKLSSNNEEGN